MCALARKCMHTADVKVQNISHAFRVLVRQVEFTGLALFFAQNHEDAHSHGRPNHVNPMCADVDE